MSDKNSLIDLDASNDVIIKLLNMLENFAGWVIMPKGKRADFEDGLTLYKDSIMNDDNLAPIEKAARISLSRTILRKYINQTKIISNAINNISKNANPDNLDVDWLNFFLSYAENISDEQMQLIWGKLLASKINGVSNINRKVLQIFSCIEKEDINVFCKLCSMTFRNTKKEESIYPFIYMKKHPAYYNKLGIRRYHLASLDNLGLIEYDIHSGFVLPQKVPDISFKNKTISLISNERINNGNVRFTQVGQALYNITQVSALNGFIEFCMNVWNEDNVKYIISEN